MLFHPSLVFGVAMLAVLSSSLAGAEDAAARAPKDGGRMIEKPGSNHGKAAAGSVLRHVVLFRFKDTATAADVDRIVEAFRGLPARIPEIRGFEWGTDVSPEGKAQGFTHCFLVTFASEAARDVYLPHPAHKEFVALVGPQVDKVCVVDFWSRP